MTELEKEVNRLRVKYGLNTNHPVGLGVAGQAVSDILRHFEKFARRSEQENKYRWHDLRKNPKDNPPYFEPVLIAVQDKNDGKVYHTVSHFGLHDSLWGVPIGAWACYTHGNPVIKWRYIEPSEED